MPDNARPVLILTRPAAAAARFCAQEAAMLERMPVIISPVLDIRACPATLPRKDYAGVIFTSENGAAQAARLGVPAHLPAYCVGGQTARAAEVQGFATHTAGGDAESLVAMLGGMGVTGPLVHIRGAHARGAVAERLSAQGIPTDAVVAYDQIAVPLSPQALAALGGTAPVVLPLYSPRSAALLAQEIAANLHGPCAPLHLAAISAAAAAPFGPWHAPDQVIGQATGQATGQLAGHVRSCHVASAPLGPQMALAVHAAIKAAFAA